MKSITKLFIAFGLAFGVVIGVVGIDIKPAAAETFYWNTTKNAMCKGSHHKGTPGVVIVPVSVCPSGLS